jgi:hypothetical protein
VCVWNNRVSVHFRPSVFIFDVSRKRIGWRALW